MGGQTRMQSLKHTHEVVEVTLSYHGLEAQRRRHGERGDGGVVLAGTTANLPTKVRSLHGSLDCVPNNTASKLFMRFFMSALGVG